jgi:hypothetical protein
MKRFLTLVVPLLIFGISAYSQHAKPNISFKATIHNFGDIQESDGLKNHEFKFTNTGGQPLVIHHVNASCGCTTPTWTRKPIPPGGQGFIKVAFNPENRPGNFNKTITVTSNAQNASMVLRITGKVIPREPTLEDKYPSVMGNLRLETTHLAFTKVGPKTKKTEQLKVLNSSDAPLELSFINVPAHLKIECQPTVIEPGKTGVIIGHYDAELKNDWGFVVDNVFVNFNGVKEYKHRLTISASIEENFEAWSDEQKENAPVISIPEKVYNFGDITQGDKVEHKFKVTNTGKSNLVFRKIKASCGCTAIKPQKMVLTPGESTDIVAVFDSKGRSGRQNKSVTVISNDPTNTNILLRISGNVKVQ